MTDLAGPMANGVTFSRRLIGYLGFATILGCSVYREKAARLLRRLRNTLKETGDTR